MGMLAIGNGEKCPFCEKILSANPEIPGEPTMKHLQENHNEEMVKALFQKRNDNEKI